MSEAKPRKPSAQRTRSASAARLARWRADVGGAVSARLGPERTRQPTLFERLTVTRLRWAMLVRIHRWLEFLGKLATALYVAFIATAVLGVDWRHSVEAALNSGAPIKGAIVLAIALPTLLFVVLRSSIGWLRWRCQRELWRRDVARLTAAGDDVSRSGS